LSLWKLLISFFNSTSHAIKASRLHTLIVRRCAEFEAEIGSVRDIVMVLGKAIGKQPRGQELPSHEDPVWAKLGPLGGVQFALEVIMKHTRVRRQGAGCLIRSCSSGTWQYFDKWKCCTLCQWHVCWQQLLLVSWPWQTVLAEPEIHHLACSTNHTSHCL
jgi:hypothetical protein